MTMQSIRQFYSIPAKRGMRITHEGKPATITGTTRGPMYLRVRFDDDPKQTFPIHPTWAVKYPSNHKGGPRG